MAKPPVPNKNRFFLHAILIAVGLTAVMYLYENFEAFVKPSTPAVLTNFQHIYGQQPAPLYTFLDGQGKRVQLADFAGKLVILNFWATWCAPCLKEMPSLDHLQAAVGDQAAVVAVSLDQEGVAAVRSFYKKQNLKNLKVYLDPASQAAGLFQLRGLPTTFLVSPEGILIGKIEKAAAWDDPALLPFLERFIQN